MTDTSGYGCTKLNQARVILNLLKTLLIMLSESVIWVVLEASPPWGPQATPTDADSASSAQWCVHEMTDEAEVSLSAALTIESL